MVYTGITRTILELLVTSVLLIPFVKNGARFARKKRFIKNGARFARESSCMVYTGIIYQGIINPRCTVKPGKIIVWFTREGSVWSDTVPVAAEGAASWRLRRGQRSNRGKAGGSVVHVYND